MCKHLTLSTLVSSAMYRTRVRNQLSNQWLSERALERGIRMSKLRFFAGTQNIILSRSCKKTNFSLWVMLQPDYERFHLFVTSKLKRIHEPNL